MASNLAMCSEIMKGKIRKVLSITASYASEFKPPLPSTLVPCSGPRNSLSGQICPFGSSKITIVKASLEFTQRALGRIFCQLRDYKYIKTDDNQLLGCYLSVFELAAPGIMASAEALQYFKDFGYVVTYDEVKSDKGLEVSRGLELSPKATIIGICLYVLLIVELKSFDHYSFLAFHVKEISTKLGIQFEPEGFWMKNFASKETCLALRNLVNVQPLKANCFRALQQMAKINSIGRDVFANLLQKLRWFKMEHLGPIINYLLEDPYVELLSAPPLDLHLYQLKRALFFLDGLPPCDIPYAYFLRDEIECWVLDKDHLTVFLVAARAIHARNNSSFSYADSNLWDSGYYRMYPEMTPYLKYVEDTVLEMLISGGIIPALPAVRRSGRKRK